MRAIVSVVALLATVAGLAASPARAACPPFPTDVPEWRGLSHAGVERYVATRLDGDWQRYEAAMAAALAVATTIRDDGGTAIVGDDRRLAGAELDRYVRQLTRRLGVTRCLARAGSASADKSDAVGDASVSEFATAAGGDFSVEIVGRCRGDQGMIRITNVGEAWPNRAHLIVRDATDALATPIAMRVLRMVEGQTATFYVEPQQALNISITPTWGPPELVRELPPSCPDA